MEYREKIDKIVEEIIKINEDVIIVGDNSSGKSDILKSVIKNLPQSECYYIDSSNRVFEYKNTLDTGNNLPKTENVLKVRLEEENFNLKDSFGNGGNIERYYSIYKTKFLGLINEFLEKDIIIEEESGINLEKVLKVDGEIYEYLSNGYQAIFRIFLETH